MDMLEQTIYTAIHIIMKAPSYHEYSRTFIPLDSKVMLLMPKAHPEMTDVLNAFSPMEGAFVVNRFDVVYRLAHILHSVQEMRLSFQRQELNFDDYLTIEGWKDKLTQWLWDTDVMYVANDTQLQQLPKFIKVSKGFRVVTKENIPEFQIPQAHFSPEVAMYRLSVRRQQSVFSRKDEFRVKSVDPRPLLGGVLERVNAIKKFKIKQHVYVDRVRQFAIGDYPLAICDESSSIIQPTKDHKVLSTMPATPQERSEIQFRRVPLAEVVVDLAPKERLEEIDDSEMEDMIDNSERRNAIRRIVNKCIPANAVTRPGPGQKTVLGFRVSTNDIAAIQATAIIYGEPFEDAARRHIASRELLRHRAQIQLQGGNQHNALRALLGAIGQRRDAGE